MSEVVQDKIEQITVEEVVVEEQAQEPVVVSEEVSTEAPVVVAKEVSTEVPVVEEVAATNDDIAMEDIESTPVVEQPPNVHAVLKQLGAIFDPENLKKDNFFRELVERDAGGCKFVIDLG